MKYHEKISFLLSSKGISIREFAKGIEREYANAHAIKDGKVKKPHPATQRNIAKFFGLTVEQVFNEAVPLPFPGEASTSVSENQIQSLRDMIAIKEKIIADKDAEIAWLRGQLDAFAALGKARDAGSAVRTTRSAKTERRRVGALL